MGWRTATLELLGIKQSLHHLLNTLVAQSSIRKIICVAVRQLSERLRTNQLPPPDGRIMYHEGDLSLPRFGLSEKEEAAIFNEVDAVIHNGADTSHFKYYSALRDANAGSTHQLVRLCLQRMVPLHYVSAGVALFAMRHRIPQYYVPSEVSTEPDLSFDGSSTFELCGTL